MEAITVIKDKTANPAPLGLIGFGLTTILLNLHNAGFFEMNAMILGMGVFLGGVAQIIAGIMEWRKGNTFGTTAFISYGLFWLSLVSLIVLPQFGISPSPDPVSMSAYLFVWGIFTLFLFIGTFKLNGALQIVFGTLTLLYFLLAAGDLTENEIIKQIAGFEGIICGLSAFYTAVAQVLNELYEKPVLPLWPVKK